MLDTSNPQADALTIVLVTSVEVLGPAAAMLVVGDRDSDGVVNQNQRRLGLRVAHVVERERSHTTSVTESVSATVSASAVDNVTRCCE